MTSGNLKRCSSCGAEFSSSAGRTVCMDCFCGRYNRQPGTPQADAVDRPGNPNARPIETAFDNNLVYEVPRTYAVRLAEGFAMLGGAG